MKLSNKDIAEGFSYVLDAGKNERHLRSYLGMSQLGDSCAKKLWFYFRWATKASIPWRIERIFKAGNDTEIIIINELKRIGIKVSGQQNTLTHTSDFIQGHSDGILEGIPELNIPVLLEAKSMKQEKWKSCVKNGIKAIYKSYWCQAQVYMNKLELQKALFIVLNKNTSELYFELIDYDKVAAEALLQRGEDIVLASVPPKGISEDPSWYECSWCDFKGVCHENKAFGVTCRTCKQVIMSVNGWSCRKHQVYLTLDNQKDACSEYDMLEV